MPFLRVWLADNTISPENGPASRRLARLVENDVLTREPYKSLHVPVDAYLANGSNYETVRLIALSDNVLGRDSNYSVLFDSAVEAIRKHPGTYARGVAGLFWDFLMQRPIREGVAPRAQTAPEPPRPTYVSNGVVLPNPQATVLLEGVPYGFVWCASDYIDSCTLKNPSLRLPDPAVQKRYREVVSQIRHWDAELPSRSGQAWVDGDPQPDHAAVPAPAALACGGRDRAPLAEAPGLAGDRRPVVCGRRRPPHPRRVARPRA